VSYAIITVGGKQYRVREGEQLLVDRVALEDGATFAPPVLLVGGDGAPALAPEGVTVTAKVVEQAKGPKILIGKYKKRTGYKRHTGFRASLTRIQIESIGSGTARASAKQAETAKPAPAQAEAAPSEPVAAPAVPETPTGGLPEGYAGMTVAEIKQAAGAWEPDAVAAALAYEQEHGKRKGALAALESALAEEVD
jgi:large subunit ribosomal protein L21